MSVDYPELRRDLLRSMKKLRNEIPEAMNAFAELGKVAYGDGALEPKHKELIALGISIASNCDGCIGFHTRSSLVKGATRQEILETIAVAIQMGGGPSMINGTQALEAVEQYEAVLKK